MALFADCRQNDASGGEKKNWNYVNECQMNALQTGLKLKTIFFDVLENFEWLVRAIVERVSRRGF